MHENQATNMQKLTHAFVVSRTSEVPALPVSWYVKRKKDQKLYSLNLRACQIASVAGQIGQHFDLSAKSYALVQDKDYTKDGEAEKNADALDEDPLQFPEVILKVDLSLNEIEHLSIQDLVMFPELRSLELSLNTIKTFEGIETAIRLVYLNLSYNAIQAVSGVALSECANLQHLDLSANKIDSLVGFPALPNLIRLHIWSNKLKSFKGLEVLRSLKQVHARKNKITSIIHLCACLEMTELDVADNLLQDMSDIVGTLTPLQRLQQMKLEGNPILQCMSSHDLQAAIMRESSVVLLDEVNIRPMKSQFNSFSNHQPPAPKNEIKVHLKGAVKESMKERVQRKREKTQEEIRFLHKKMLTLLDELEDYENSSVADTEAWCRYIDMLKKEEVKSLTASQIRAAAIAEPDGYLPSLASSRPRQLNSKTDVRKQQTDSSQPGALLDAVADALAKHSV